MHDFDIRGSIHRHICHVRSTQMEETRMELRYQSGDLVCRSVLRLCHDRSSRLICRSQILLCTFRPSSALLSLRLFPFHLYPCIGTKFFSFETSEYDRMRLWSVCVSAVSLSRASGDLQMGYRRCSRVHVCDFCCSEPQSAYQFRWGEIDPDNRKHLSIAAGACGCAEALSLHCHSMIHIFFLIICRFIHKRFLLLRDLSKIFLLFGKLSSRIPFHLFTL